MRRVAATSRCGGWRARTARMARYTFAEGDGIAATPAADRARGDAGGLARLPVRGSHEQGLAHLVHVVETPHEVGIVSLEPDVPELTKSLQGGVI